MPAPKGNQYGKGGKGGGRPSMYKPEFAAAAVKLCKLGATDMDLADFFGVSAITINNWKMRHEAFSLALKSGKEASDERVERSLFHKAVGYTFESEKIFQHQGTTVRAKTREHVPPDTAAAIFWLKNRRPEVWRDIAKFEHTGKDGGAIQHQEVGEARELVNGRISSLVERIAEDQGSKRTH